MRASASARAQVHAALRASENEYKVTRRDRAAAARGSRQGRANIAPRGGAARKDMAYPPPSLTLLTLGGLDPPPSMNILALGGLDPPPSMTASVGSSSQPHSTNDADRHTVSRTELRAR